MWATDMANRTVDTDWNILSRQEWLAGWQEMLVPGTYERGIFGDLMLPGIACGIQKILLIFNTNPESPHDPIYVVDPRQFNIQPDTDIPIILAYNLSHYESMHPSTDADTRATAELVKEYLGNGYRFDKNDFPFLLGLEDLSHSPTSTGKVKTKKLPTRSQEEATPSKILKVNTEFNHKSRHTDLINKLEDDAGVDLEEIDEFLDSFKSPSPSKPNPVLGHKKDELKRKEKGATSLKEKLSTDKSKHKKTNTLDDDDFEYHTHQRTKLSQDNTNSSKLSDKFTNFQDFDAAAKKSISEEHLYYKLKNKGKEYPILEANGKFICPFCEILV